jgi:magnesium transporter
VCLEPPGVCTRGSPVKAAREGIMLTYYRIADQKIEQCSKEDGTLLVCVAPQNGEMQELLETYQIPEHDIRSCLDVNELGRVALEEDYSLLILKRPKNYSTLDNLLFKIDSLGIFLVKGKMIIVMAEAHPLLEGKHFAKIKTLNDVFVKILLGTVAHFLGHLNGIQMISEDLEQKISASMSNKYLIQMFALEKSLVYYLNAINSNARVFEKLRINAAKLGFAEENVEMLDDIIIDNQQCQKQTEIYLNILTGLMDARGSIVGNNLNVLIKRLTLINIIFMPLAFLAGIGGMSEYTMMTEKLGIGWKLGYPLFFVVAIIIGLLTYRVVNTFLKRGGTE